MVGSIVTCQTIPPTSDETPVTLSPQSANRQTGGSILKHPNMRLVFQVIFFQMFQILRLRILKLQACIVGPNGLLAVRRQQLMVPFKWDSACLIHCAAGNAAREMLGCTVFFFVTCLYRQGWRDVIGHSEAIFLSSPMEKSTSSLFARDQASSGHVFYQIPKKNNLNLGMSMFETPKLPSVPFFLKEISCDTWAFHENIFTSKCCTLAGAKGLH